MTVDELRERFREAGRHVPSKKRAVDILAAIPAGCVATGWDEEELLDTLVKAPGAVDRLVAMYKEGLRRGVYH